MSFIRIGKKSLTPHRNVSLQFINKVKAPPVRTFEFTRLLLQSIFDNISDSINGKDEDALYSKEEPSLDNSFKFTSYSWSLNPLGTGKQKVSPGDLLLKWFFCLKIR